MFNKKAKAILKNLKLINEERTSEHLDYRKTQTIIYSWFLNSINQETRRQVEKGFKPSKIFVKDLIQCSNDKEILLYINTNFGPLDIIIDPNMNELLRVE